MSSVAKAFRAYDQARRAQPPLKVMVEVFDAVLTQVARAKAARMERRREDEFRSMTKATRILSEMEARLNRRDEEARAMTDTMSRYYKMVVLQAHAAFRSKDEEGIERYSSVHRQVLIMRDAWAKLAGEPALLVVPVRPIALAG